MPSAKAARDLQIVDSVLTQVARQFKPSGYIYDQLCPSIPVTTISGQYPVFDDRYWFSNVDSNKVTDRMETPEIEFAWSTDSYLIEDYALKVSITRRERQQAHPGLRLEASKVQLLMTRMANAREARLAALLKKTTNGGGFTSGAAAGAAWSASTSIEADVKTAKLAIYNLTGVDPNVLVIPYAKAYDMATNPTLRDIFKYQVGEAASAFFTLGGQDELLLPKTFHGLKVIVPKGTLAQTGHEGATKSLADVWGTSARVMYVDPNAGWGIPSTVYQFQHPVLTEDTSAGPNGPVVDRWSEKDPPRDLIRATEAVDEKICAPDLGYEISGL